ncbi:MAG: hypothetical protein ACOC95_06475, partial [Planctomycetota bacterium]
MKQRIPSRRTGRPALLCLVMATLCLAGTPVAGETATFVGHREPPYAYDVLEQGVWSGRDFACPPVTTLNVFSPTWNIFPSASSTAPFPQEPGVWFRHRGANGSDGSNVWAGDGGTGAGALGLTFTFLADPWYVWFSGRNPEVDDPVQGMLGSIQTRGDGSYGTAVESVAGNGGRGGDLYSIIYGKAGDGGRGGNGGDVNATVTTGTVGNLVSTIFTEGQYAHGIFALSQGGAGGRGGDSHVAGVAIGGNGGLGGRGGAVSVDATIAVVTEGETSHGILARSLGGAAGGAGGAGGLYGGGGDAGDSGHGGTVDVISRGAIDVKALNSDGILAQSIGGFAFGGGGGGGGVFYGGSGGSSGNGNTVSVTNHGRIDARGAGGSALVAQSIGGGGGRGGAGGGVSSLGASGGAGGDGGSVNVANTGRLVAYQDDSAGLIAQSIGGGGGTGAGTGGFVAVGGSQGSSGDGDNVTVTNTGIISTAGVGGDALFAQSVGGGGGRAAASGGAFVFGGSGDSGGAGGAVQVTNNANLATRG